VTFELGLGDEVYVDCDNAINPVSDDCKLTVHFDPVARMKVTNIKISYKPSDGGGSKFIPNDADMADVRKRMLALFPTHEVHTREGAIGYPGTREVYSECASDFFSFATCDDGSDFFAEILSDLSDMRPWFDDRIWYGVVVDDISGDDNADTTIFDKADGGSIGGKGMAPGDVSAGIHTGTGGSLYNVFGQEIGHNFGIGHTLWKETDDSDWLDFEGIGPCKAPVEEFQGFFPYIHMVNGKRRAALGRMDWPDEFFNVGWDSERDRFLSSWTTFDTMSYCPGISWPSSYTLWNLALGIKDYFGDGSSSLQTASTSSTSSTFASASSTSSTVPVENSENTSFSVVRGFISPDEDSVKFKPIALIANSPVLPPPTPAGDFLLLRLDKRGALVDELSFAPNKTAGHGVQTGPPAPLDEYFSVPFPVNPDVHEVRLLHNGVDLGSLTASKNVPTVEVLFPNGGEVLANGQMTFSWKGADKDKNDVLTYDVMYSADGGTNWEAIAVNYPGTSLPVTIDYLKGSQQALLRVYVRDGFNASYDDSNATFIVPNSSPDVDIFLPKPFNVFGGPQLIVFKALSSDIEDFDLTDQNITWSSSIDGFLGYGHNFNMQAADLTPGDHLITLTGTDSGGGAGTATVRIRVFGDVFPAMTIANIKTSPEIIWPPNHEMVEVIVDPNVLTKPKLGESSCEIISITSSESDDDTGDGSTLADFIITGPLTAEVRAERMGGEVGRIYSITVACSINDGETTHAETAVGIVKVPAIDPYIN